ncbi:hypothetical protein ADUPG1_001914, partial [Aduncisulcus paluster]
MRNDIKTYLQEAGNLGKPGWSDPTVEGGGLELRTLHSAKGYKPHNFKISDMKKDVEKVIMKTKSAQVPLINRTRKKQNENLVSNLLELDKAKKSPFGDYESRVLNSVVFVPNSTRRKFGNQNSELDPLSDVKEGISERQAIRANYVIYEGRPAKAVEYLQSAGCPPAESKLTRHERRNIAQKMFHKVACSRIGSWKRFRAGLDKWNEPDVPFPLDISDIDAIIRKLHATSTDPIFKISYETLK